MSSGECVDVHAPPSAPSHGSNTESGASMSSTVSAMGLDPRMTDESVYYLFRPYGPIFQCEVARDVITGASKCVAVVGFVHAADACNAVAGMHGRALLLHDAVELSRPPPPPPSLLDANGCVQSTPQTVLQVHLVGSAEAPLHSRRGGSSVSTKLFVRRVPMFATNASLARYFGQFGHVTECALYPDVSIRCQVEGGLWNLAYVTFARADDAYRVSRLEHADIALGPHREFHHGPLFVKLAKAIESNRSSNNSKPNAVVLGSAAHYHRQSLTHHPQKPAQEQQGSLIMSPPGAVVLSEAQSTPQAQACANFAPATHATAYGSSLWSNYPANTTDGCDSLGLSWTAVQHTAQPPPPPPLWMPNTPYAPAQPFLQQSSFFIPGPAAVPLMLVPAPPPPGSVVCAARTGDIPLRRPGLGVPPLMWQPNAVLQAPVLPHVALPEDPNLHLSMGNYFPR